MHFGVQQCYGCSMRDTQRQTRRIHNTLDKWDACLSPTLRDKFLKSQQRRAFLGGLLKSASLLPACTTLMTLPAEAEQAQDDLGVLQEEPWPTLAVVQQQLFPRDGNGPGAQDIRASEYLYWVVAAPDMDKEEREFILNGVDWLNGVAAQRFGTAFKKLEPAQREQVLRKVAASEAGENWLATLLLYLFEALLSAPVYGGNPDGIGWRWLEHQPGYPLPPKDKLYLALIKARR